MGQDIDHSPLWGCCEVREGDSSFFLCTADVAKSKECHSVGPCGLVRVRTEGAEMKKHCVDVWACFIWVAFFWFSLSVVFALYVFLLVYMSIWYLVAWVSHYKFRV